MTTQQISKQVRQLILDGELDDAANAPVQFLDKDSMREAYTTGFLFTTNIVQYGN